MLARIGLYAAMLAAAGVPLYIHLPRYASVELGLSLGTLGAVLLGTRVVDFAQDPLLDWLTESDAVSLQTWAGIGAVGLGVGFWALLGMASVGDPVIWLVAVLIVVYITSGAALGADMVLRPALFSVALDEEEVQGGAGFGLWSLVTKWLLYWPRRSRCQPLIAQVLFPVATTARRRCGRLPCGTPFCLASSKPR